METLIKLVLAVILPPLGALMQVGLGVHFWLNIILTMFGWFPGVIHAAWLILSEQK